MLQPSTIPLLLGATLCRQIKVKCSRCCGVLQYVSIHNPAAFGRYIVSSDQGEM